MGPWPATSPGSPRSSSACTATASTRIAAAEADDPPDLQSLTRGLKRDYDAVKNGLTMQWRSGAVKGNVNRLLRPSKRKCSHPSFDLLRHCVLLVT